jgi:arylsulfatase A-like enzyme
VCGLAGCDGDTTANSGRAATPSRSGEPGASSQAPDLGWRDVYTFIDALDQCDVDHRGLLFDFGSGDMARRYGWRLLPPTGIVHTEHDGATWARLYERRIRVRFFLPEPARVFVALRALGKDARRVRVLIDGYSVASLRLDRKRASTTKTPLTRLPLDAGMHDVELRFRAGRRAGTSQPFAELDWLRIASADRIKRTYGAPTRFHLVETKAVVDGSPRRAIALRAPGTLRCGLLVPAGGRLRFDAGLRGTGSAEIRVRIRRDMLGSTEVSRLLVEGGEKARWQSVDIALDNYEDKIVAVEIDVIRSTGTGRLFIGEPRIVVPQVAAPVAPPARSVVVVVLDGVARDDLPPWRAGPTPHLPNLNMLAREATVFSAHRGASTSVAAAVASLLSGRPPRGHGVLDTNSRLPTSVATLGSIAREASIVGAMFSGVPMTSAAFGFASQWDDFRAYPPNGGRLASAPLDDAGAWLVGASSEKPAIAVIHTRGGHPPFEITANEARDLPPKDYAGYLEPRRAAQEIAKARGRLGRLSEADRERLRGLFMVSLAGQDHALGELIRRLSDAGRYKDTLLIVTAGVASARRSLFVDGLPLDEALLTLPLYVHFPGDRLAGQRSLVATQAFDVTRTVTDALRLEPPRELRGDNLFNLVKKESSRMTPIRFAQIQDRYAARLGDFVLRGKLGERPRLCHLSIDPTCAFDRSALFPIVTDVIFRRAARFVASETPTPIDALTMDSETAATLKVWGAY